MSNGAGPNRYSHLPRKMFDAYTERQDLKIQRLKNRLNLDIRALEERLKRLEGRFTPLEEGSEKPSRGDD